MIEVSVRRDVNNDVMSFSVKGHSGYAQAGSDIICAAVSAICYTTVGYFHEKRLDNKDVCFTERDGLMQFALNDVLSSDDMIRAQAVLEAFVIGIKQIEAEYGKKYVRLYER